MNTGISKIIKDAGAMSLLTYLVKNAEEQKKEGLESVNSSAFFDSLVMQIMELPDNPNAKNKHEDTALHLAASAGSHGLCLAMVRRGADINAKDAQGNTPLMIAAIAGKKRMFNLLVSLGADLAVRDNEGNDAAKLLEYFYNQNNKQGN